MPTVARLAGSGSGSWPVGQIVEEVKELRWLERRLERPAEPWLERVYRVRLAHQWVMVNRLGALLILQLGLSLWAVWP